MKHYIAKHIIALFSGLVIAAATTVAQTVLVQDNFTLTGTRTAGSVLNGTNPESGYYKDYAAAVPTWNANWHVTQGATSTIFSNGGTIVASGNNASNEARIALGAPTDIITVSASLVTNTSDWVAIGFASDTSTGTFVTTGVGSVWVALTSSGINVYRNGTVGTQSKTWASTFAGTLGAFDASKAYTVTLKFDPSNNKAHVTVSDGANTVSLLPDNAGSPGGWFPVNGITASSIGAAGFRINGKAGTTAGAASIDNFLVTTNATLPPPPGVPEPASAAMILGLVALAGLLARKCWKNSRR